MKTENYILIILDTILKSEELSAFIKDALRKYDVEIILAENALDGLIKFTQYAPCLVIVDANLQTLNGFSLSAIIKGTKIGEKCTVYMVVDEFTVPNSKCDYYITKPIKRDILALQLQSFFEKKRMALYHINELLRAKHQQNELLPHKLATESFKVDYIYSPFNDLSGDCLDFWYGENENGLYGFLFDCTGHDLCSFLQVSEVRIIFRWGFRHYQKNIYKNLGDIMKNVNTELFNSHGDKVSCVAAIIFYLDFRTNLLKYCSAGIPSFFIKKAFSNQYMEIEMSNYLIGYEPQADFIEKSLPLQNDVDEVVFSSDGFSDLLFKQANHIDNPKHDDVSAIFIQLSRGIIQPK